MNEYKQSNNTHICFVLGFLPKTNLSTPVCDQMTIVESHPTSSPRPSPHQTSGYRPGAGGFCCWDQDNASSFHSGRGGGVGTYCLQLSDRGGELRLLLSVVQFIIVRSALRCNITLMRPKHVDVKKYNWVQTVFAGKRSVIPHIEWSFHFLS